MLGATGTGVMLMAGDDVQGSLCTTNAVSALIEELQYSLGEGPCLDAYHQDQPITEPDLASPHIQRWLAFTATAVDAGALAVFAFPLKAGTVRLGSLDLYMDRPGSLGDDQLADGLVIADLVANWLLDTQAATPLGSLSEQLGAGDFHLAVHNAAGMVSVQLGVSVAEALLRLRAHAFGEDRLLSSVARDVIARRLRFD